MTVRQLLDEINQKRGKMTDYQFAKLSDVTWSQLQRILETGGCNAKSLVALGQAAGYELVWKKISKPKKDEKI